MNKNNQIIYITEPTEVSMADEWYDYTTLNHFWIRHRNFVFDRHFSKIIRNSQLIGEIGCGNGLMLSYIASQYEKAVDGFELNLAALEMCSSVPGNLYIYDILTRNPQFIEKYDVIMLLDVIEHIEDETPFLLAAREHLKPDGLIIIGVPMRQELYSAYDTVAGHYRRYSTRSLKGLVHSCGFEVKKIIHWGHVFIPLLILRKAMLARAKKEDIIRKGFGVSNFMNACLSPFKYLEYIPTFDMIGSSSFLLAQKNHPIEFNQIK